MNNQRRKELRLIQASLLNIIKMTDKDKITVAIEDVLNDLELVRGDEETALTAMPENLFFSEGYAKLEANSDELSGIIMYIEGILNEVETSTIIDIASLEKEVNQVINDINNVIER